MTNIRYADDAVFLAENGQQLQHIIGEVGAACEQFVGLLGTIAKKTKTAIVTKIQEKQCDTNVERTDIHKIV